MKKLAIILGVVGLLLVLRSNVAKASPINVTIGPSGAESKETFISQDCDDRNQGENYLYVLKSGGSEARSLLQFNFTSIPADATINSAVLTLEPLSLSTPSADFEIAAHRLTSEWVEGNGTNWCSWRPDIRGGATWALAKAGTSWTTAGGDFDSAVEGSTAVATGSALLSWDITSLVGRWVAGTVPNYGLILVPQGISSGEQIFYAADHPLSFDSPKRPKLHISYTPKLTPPPVTTINLSGVLGNNNWYTSDVYISFSVVDNSGSGIDKTEYSYDNNSWTLYTGTFAVTSEGPKKVYYRSVDKRGQVEETKNQDIKIDKTAPVVTGVTTTQPNTNGWFNSQVTVHFDATDVGSGVATVTPDVVLSSEGGWQTVEGVATDMAGNTASVWVSDLSIDRTPPEALIYVPLAGSNFQLNEQVMADWMTYDMISGVANEQGTTPTGTPIDTSSAGTKSFSVTATDWAGNQTSAQVSYQVVSPTSNYLIKILFPNEDNRKFKIGWAMPVLFRLFDPSSNIISNLKARLYLISDAGEEFEAEPATFLNRGNLFTPVLRLYTYILKTRELTPGSWTLKIILEDGTSSTVNVYFFR